MNKRRKQIIWITCLIAVLTLGVTTANISKADRLEQREIVDNISNELNDTENDEKNKESKTDEIIDEEKNNNTDNKESEFKNKDEEENIEEDTENIEDIDNAENTEDTNKVDDESKDNKESKKDNDYSNSSKNAYEIFMGNGLHVIGQVYAEDNKPLSFDGKWFALEDTQYVYAIEESKEDNITLYKAYVLIDNKESYIYFNVDAAKKINVLGYKEIDEDTVSNNRYNQEEDYKNITSDLKVVPIYKYVNKDTGEDGKRYGSETSVGEKVIVVKKLRKWSSAQM